MQITIKGYITSKATELISDCADRFAFSEVHHKFSISDGVSKSFFPKYWAEYLVNEFVSKGKIDEEKFLRECQEKWLKKITEIVSKPNVKYFTQNAFNNRAPALATFVGLQLFEKEKKWEASALGDSFLFYLPKSRKSFKDCIKLSSKTEPIVFDNYPDYFSSVGEKFKGTIKKTAKRDLESGAFYLMTDALAEWFINEEENAIGKINVWKDQEDFNRFVNEERLSEKLGNDDSAILIISIEDDSYAGITYSEENSVSDIYKLIEQQEQENNELEKEVFEKEADIENKKLDTVVQETEQTQIKLENVSTIEQINSESIKDISEEQVEQEISGSIDAGPDDSSIQIPKNLEKPVEKKSIRTKIKKILPWTNESKMVEDETLESKELNKVEETDATQESEGEELEKTKNIVEYESENPSVSEDGSLPEISSQETIKEIEIEENINESEQAKNITDKF